MDYGIVIGPYVRTLNSLCSLFRVGERDWGEGAIYILYFMAYLHSLAVLCTLYF